MRHQASSRLPAAAIEQQQSEHLQRNADLLALAGAQPWRLFVGRLSAGAQRTFSRPWSRADMKGDMPTHRDMPRGWADTAARRRAEIDTAEERARALRAELQSLTQRSTADLQAADRARAATSLPPPS